MESAAGCQSFSGGIVHPREPRFRRFHAASERVLRQHVVAPADTIHTRCMAEYVTIALDGIDLRWRVRSAVLCCRGMQEYGWQVSTGSMLPIGDDLEFARTSATMET